jgi:ABC-type phosphate transport system substrate-binding protein
VENETASLTRNELARMFRKTQTEWEDGEHCIPIDQAGGDIRSAFGRIVLEQTPDEWKRYWIQQTMTGNARQPIALDSSETVKKYVRKLKGAVAYIYESEVDDTVRVVTITDAPELLASEETEESNGQNESGPTPEEVPTPAQDGAEAPK